MALSIVYEIWQGSNAIKSGKRQRDRARSYATSAGEMGDLVYTKINEPGYPEVEAVNTSTGVLPWWAVLGVEL